MSMSSDLGSMTHAEFVNAYGGPQELEDYLEMQALSALTPSSSGGGDPRVQTVTDASPVTVTITADVIDLAVLEGTRTGTITVAAPTGTVADGKVLKLRIKSTSARTLSFDAAFRFSNDLPAPVATSSSSLTDYLVFQWNATGSRWDAVGKNFGF